jgi:glyoxylate/hydroxypyruvate reductase A
VTMLLLNPFRGTNEGWQAALEGAVDGLEVRIWPDAGNAEDIEYIMIGGIDLAELPDLPNLKLMVSLYAGVEALLANPHLPDAPLVKAEPMAGDTSLTEYAVTHVLRHHRNLPAYQAQQARHEWKGLPHKRAAERTVGFLGYGLLSKPMADLLTDMNFNVIAWARTPKPDAPIEVFHGPGGFGDFLQRSEITVCMLPLTSATEGILDADAFAKMPEGAAVINLGRGAHVIDVDLIAALDSGHLAAATLDVTSPEPLPPESPLWDHTQVTVMPHAARRPNISDSLPLIVENLRRVNAGEPLQQLVDRDAGY